jgi:uncharacterized protein (TIGR02453 family)
MADAIFTSGLMKFLRDLSSNNDREWFEANRDRYERDMLEPALEFIEAFAPYLRRISPHFVASTKRSGGSLFRIHRDIRFSKDKTPYKTHLGIQFRHEAAKDAHAPGFYFHIQPGESFAGAGIWHPDNPTLTNIRQAIVDDPRTWKRVAYGKRFGDNYELAGDSLKRPPRGFDEDHPYVEDLKRKDFVGMSSFSEREITSEDLLKNFSERCRGASGFVEFLCGATGLSF